MPFSKSYNANKMSFFTHSLLQQGTYYICWLCVYNGFITGLFYTTHTSELKFIRYLIKYNTL